MGSNIETLTVKVLVYQKRLCKELNIYISVSIVQPVSHLELQFWCF